MTEVRSLLLAFFFDYFSGVISSQRKNKMVVTTSRGHNLEERLAKHFGQSQPGGYRKAARMVKEAARFQRPVFMFVDTAEAFPGKEAEYMPARGRRLPSAS